MKPVIAVPCLCLALCLAACEQIAELDGSKTADADGRAVGGACRHAGRALEDCYALNERAPRPAVFAGWREMNDYMTQNKIDTVTPQVPKKLAAGKPDGVAAKAERRDEAAAPKQAVAVKETGAPSVGLSGAAAAGTGGAQLTKEGLPQHLLPVGATGRESEKPAQ